MCGNNESLRCMFRQVCVYNYIGGELRVYSLCGYFGQGAEAVSEVVPGAGIPGSPSAFRFRVPVVCCCVDVNYC